MDDLYHQEILDHYHHPDHFGTLDNADNIIEESNASCGDMFKFFLTLDAKKTKIVDLTFTGTGCAISTAACSLLISQVIGQPLTLIHKIDQAHMQQLIGAPITPARLKCLMLPARALNKLINPKK